MAEGFIVYRSNAFGNFYIRQVFAFIKCTTFYSRYAFGNIDSSKIRACQESPTVNVGNRIRKFNRQQIIAMFEGTMFNTNYLIGVFLID